MHQFELVEFPLDNQSCEFLLSCDLPEELGSASSSQQRVKLSADQRQGSQISFAKGFPLLNVWNFKSLKVTDNKSDPSDSSTGKIYSHDCECMHKLEPGGEVLFVVADLCLSAYAVWMARLEYSCPLFCDDAAQLPWAATRSFRNFRPHSDWDDAAIDTGSLQDRHSQRATCTNNSVL